MAELYDLFWSAIRGKSLDEFLGFIDEIKGSNNLKERLLAYSPSSKGRQVDLKSLVQSTPIQYRFLAFLEELVSALMVEILELEPYIPEECNSLSGFIRERAEDISDLTRDLKQEAREYKLSWDETWKADAMTRSYLLITNGITKVCGLNN